MMLQSGPLETHIDIAKAVEVAAAKLESVAIATITVAIIAKIQFLLTFDLQV